MIKTIKFLNILIAKFSTTWIFLYSRFQIFPKFLIELGKWKIMKYVNVVLKHQEKDRQILIKCIIE